MPRFEMHHLQTPVFQMAITVASGQNIMGLIIVPKYEELICTVHWNADKFKHF